MIFVGNGRGVGPLNFCGKEDGYEKEEAARGVRRVVWFPPPVHAPGRAP